GNCLSCHAQAAPKWDMICEDGHGCMPIPITEDMQIALQKTDPRCPSVPLTDEDKIALKKVVEIAKAAAAAAAAAGQPQP
ncbi:hypothetical protein VU08_08860, partial [Desulfobulbus sp. F5]|nr:hypothetical protein [Desulfobulbus sp. F5]